MGYCSGTWEHHLVPQPGTETSSLSPVRSPLLSHGPPNTGVPQAGDTKGVFVNNTQMLEVGGPKCPLEPQVHLDLSFLKWHYPSCRSPGRGELRELQWDGEWLYLM